LKLNSTVKKLKCYEGSMVMHAAEKAGTYIPHFCYHKKLSIAANCRMCLVDVEKAPKPMPACATPVTQGMMVRTKSDKAIKAQKVGDGVPADQPPARIARFATRAANASCRTWRSAMAAVVSLRRRKARGVSQGCGPARSACER
jgi:hypothetical protein